MKIPLPLSTIAPLHQSPPGRSDATVRNDDTSNIGKRLEQMLWAEMLSHSGLEKAFTQNGGEAASAFSRFMVEEIARDLAAKHSFNFGSELNLGENSNQQRKPDLSK